MEHVAIYDKNGIRSFDKNRITSSYYGKKEIIFTVFVTTVGSSNAVDRYDFEYETADDALRAYEDFLNVI